MPSVINDGEYAVSASEIVVAYKSYQAATPTVPARYYVTVVPKGVNKVYSPQFQFSSQAARDTYYTNVVNGMKP